MSPTATDMASVQQSQAPTDFPHFLQLPPEIQLMVYEHCCAESTTLVQIRYRHNDNGLLEPLPRKRKYDAPLKMAKVMPALYALLPAELSMKLGEAHRRFGAVALHVTLYPGHSAPLKCFDLQPGVPAQHVPSPDLVRGITFYFDPSHLKQNYSQSEHGHEWSSAIYDAKNIMKKYPKLCKVAFRFCMPGTEAKEWRRHASGNAIVLKLMVEDSLTHVPPPTGLPPPRPRRRPKETWPETLKISIYVHDEHIETLKCWQGSLVLGHVYLELERRAQQEQEEQERKQAAYRMRRKEIFDAAMKAREERRRRELATALVQIVDEGEEMDRGE